MKDYNPIADGEYVCDHKDILKDLGIWRKMTDEEKEPFRRCYYCQSYSKYADCPDENTCPCLTCEHHKTEVQIDNAMTTLRRKYF
jgi:hypothetical protein